MKRTKNSTKNLIALVVVLFNCLEANAQFTDSIHSYFSVSTTGNFNRTSEGSSAVSTNMIEYKRRTKKISANSMLRYVYGQQNQDLSNSDFYATQDLNRYFREQRFYAWLLASYSKIYSLDVRHQLQAGPGLAYNLIARPNLTFNVSNGILYEYVALAGEQRALSTDQTVRNSLRLQIKGNLQNTVTLKSTFFLQNSLKDFSDAIIREETEVSMRLYRILSATLKFQYNRMTSTNKETLLVTWGFTLKNYF